MSRLSLITHCAVLCAALAFAPGAAAKTQTKTCTAASPQVVGGKVSGKLFSSNVDPSQARFATCEQAKRVMRKVTALGLEEPRGDVGGFYCRPTVNAYDMDTVSYVCTFKGADTATFVKLTFKVTYKS
jgi:hypothetical protein